METTELIVYTLLCLGAFGSIFLMGWQFGCWLQECDRKRDNRDCYTDKFYDDYYAGSSCKPTKKKSKKSSKK